MPSNRETVPGTATAAKKVGNQNSFIHIDQTGARP